MNAESEPFMIASHIPEYTNPLKYDLLNLKIRLRIQKEWVARTESLIEDLEEQIKKEESKW